ncbi:tetratricopeptide repeat-containing sulfotransferase family protein [Pseudoxanthomonas sp. 10H]|uniref:tetratricopeptide repeat-containing sulfotransferase family protein n=1 Tax=Pseudoxanthomonas sp. 10H TaxID=3242729 RepID=UPI003555F9BB
MRAAGEWWQHAQRAEAVGDRAGARACYEAILAAVPGHVPAHLRMSRLEQLADRYRAAHGHAVAAADAIASGAYANLAGYAGARLLEFAEEPRLARLVTALDPDDPEVVRQSPVLSQQLWLCGEHEAALRFLAGVERHAPKHPLLEFTRANVLRYLGRMDEAERHYEACLANAPSLADAHLALSSHRRAQPAHARIPRLQAALEAATGDGDREQLLYALFREHDAAGDTDAAWQALARGATLARSRRHHDPRQERARAEALMQLDCTPGRDGQVPAGPCPVFIVGMPRTGTTVLERILGNHPHVRCLGERNDLAAATSEVTGRFLAGRPADALLHDAGMDVAAVGRRYLARLAPLAGNAGYMVDKNPLNLFSIPLILRALPGARILCLRREPMDACFSSLKELFHGDAYAYSYTQEELAAHCLLVRRWLGHWQAAAPRSVRVVDYERLVRTPATEAAAVAAFLGLEPQQALDDITRNRQPVATASSSQVREGIHDRSVGAWRRYAEALAPLQRLLEAAA